MGFLCRYSLLLLLLSLTGLKETLLVLLLILVLPLIYPSFINPNPNQHTHIPSNSSISPSHLHQISIKLSFKLSFPKDFDWNRTENRKISVNLWIGKKKVLKTNGYSLSSSPPPSSVFTVISRAVVVLISKYDAREFSYQHWNRDYTLNYGGKDQRFNSSDSSLILRHSPAWSYHHRIHLPDRVPSRTRNSRENTPVLNEV